MEAILILISSCTALAEGISIRKYSAHHPDGGFLFCAMVSFFSMAFFLITDRDGFHAPPVLWFCAILAGIFYCSASFLTYLALRCGPFAETNLILSYSVVLSIGYGIFFLRESLTPLTLPGIAVILVSLYLIRSPSGGKNPKITGKWLIFVGLSTIGSGMVGVLMKMQQLRFDDACSNEFMMITLSFSAIMLAAAGLFQKGANLRDILRHGLPYAAIAGTSNGATNFLALIINSLMPLSLASPLRTGTKILLSFLCSRILFKENISKTQLAGILIGTVGLVMLNVK